MSTAAAAVGEDEETLELGLNCCRCRRELRLLPAEPLAIGASLSGPSSACNVVVGDAVKDFSLSFIDIGTGAASTEDRTAIIALFLRAVAISRAVWPR